MADDSAAIQREINACADTLGQLMKSARIRLKEAKAANKKAEVTAALRFYDQCAAAMQMAIKGRLKKLDDSEEVADLISEFKSINKSLKGEVEKTKKLAETLKTAVKAVKLLTTIFSKALSVIA